MKRPRGAELETKAFLPANPKNLHLDTQLHTLKHTQPCWVYCLHHHDSVWITFQLHPEHRRQVSIQCVRSGTVYALFQILDNFEEKRRSYFNISYCTDSGHESKAGCGPLLEIKSHIKISAYNKITIEIYHRLRLKRFGSLRKHLLSKTNIQCN